MKKKLSIFFAVLFALSCFSVIGFAGDDQTVNQDVAELFPDYIEHHVTTIIKCPYCGKTCANSDDYAKHLETCDGYKQYVVADSKNECYWCGKTFTSERAYNQHMADLVEAKDHIKQCPYSGEDYVDGGCQATFTRKAEYDAHVAQCPHEGNYTTMGKIKHYLNVAKDFIINALKNADWGAVLSSIGSLFKALFAGVKIDL